MMQISCLLPIYFSEKNMNYLLTAVFESIKFISTATSVETFFASVRIP